MKIQKQSVRVWAVLLFCAALSTMTANAQQLKFESCGTQPLPLQLRGAQPRPMDRLCGNKGCHKSDANDRQNEAKNNLCADASQVVPLTMADFASLNQRTEQVLPAQPPGERAKPPADRTVLRNLATAQSGARIGEGRVVSFVGYVVSTRHSNVNNSSPLKSGNGESVNCNYLGCDYNDIHIEMTTDPNDAVHCNRISAEIIPHYRPSKWERFDSPDYTNYLQTHPVRITGHLFFDGSHTPCRNGQSQNDIVRFSSWEIHPVYAIEVCRDTQISACIQNESRWFAFNELQAVLGLASVKPTEKCKVVTDNPCTKCNESASCALGTGRPRTTSPRTRRSSRNRSRNR